MAPPGPAQAAQLPLAPATIEIESKLVMVKGDQRPAPRHTSPLPCSGPPMWWQVQDSEVTGHGPVRGLETVRLQKDPCLCSQALHQGEPSAATCPLLAGKQLSWRWRVCLAWAAQGRPLTGTPRGRVAAGVGGRRQGHGQLPRWARGSGCQQRGRGGRRLVRSKGTGGDKRFTGQRPGSLCCRLCVLGTTVAPGPEVTLMGWPPEPQPGSRGRAGWEFGRLGLSQPVGSWAERVRDLLGPGGWRVGRGGRH